MPDTRSTARSAARYSVTLPITGLTALLGCTLLLAWSTGDFARKSVELLTVCGVVYAVSVLLISRLGWQHLRNLERLSMTDSLCGLPNRRALHQDIMTRQDDVPEVALALLDLDGFKLVNDIYGHFVGDRLLCRCAEIFEEIAAEHGRIYRLGGDEFAIVSAGRLAGTVLEGICYRIINRFADPVMVGDRAITLGASIGLSRSTPDARHGSPELLRRSDMAMYASKSNGKMRCTWYTPELDIRREEAQRLDEDMRRALPAGEFMIQYQPLVDARSGTIASVEALIRWNRADGKPCGPDKFIPVAEESGFIDTLGAWVLTEACKTARDWDTIKLSINVSPAQLRNPAFPTLLGQVLEDTGFPPERLELEITETHFVGDQKVVSRSLDMIRGFGVGVALDDFGSGYASIGFLRQFKFEKLKIDRSLIVEAGENKASRAMMASSIALARALDMRVTAEGIETQEQADFARTAGCDQMQGWLYSRAVPASEIQNHLDVGAILDARVRAKRNVA